VALAGRRPEVLEPMAAELDIESWTTDWRELLERTDIDVIANLGAIPLHAPVSLAALAAGKHVLCEKPLAASVQDALRMEQAAADSDARTACGFHYRFVPALRLLRQLLADGRLGTIRHYRAVYLQDWLNQSPELAARDAGSIDDFSHLLDMLRHLAGEPLSVAGQTTSFYSEGDDAFLATLELADGGTASLEASRCATGWKGRHRIEINGTAGSAWWDMEDINRLHVLFAEDLREGVGGYRGVLVTEASHPFLAQWWPAGHVIGWEHAFVHQWRAFLESVLEGHVTDPLQATFGDGARAVELADAIRRSAHEGRRIQLHASAAAAA
jgi:predicted dehydrogenase